jgi:ribosome maturation factor RimP
MNATVVARAWEVAEPLVAQEGLEIVDVEYRREGRGMVLRLFLDRQGGSDEPGRGVTLDDLGRVSRQLGDLLDVADAVPGSYTLEASSPGINRRLRVPEQFRRYLGKRVRVRSATPQNGRRTFVGVLEAVEEAEITVREGESSYVIPLTEITKANYEPEA